jgi:hypothetical protein
LLQKSAEAAEQSTLLPHSAEKPTALFRLSTRLGTCRRCRRTASAHHFANQKGAESDHQRFCDIAAGDGIVEESHLSLLVKN